MGRAIGLPTNCNSQPSQTDTNGQMNRGCLWVIIKKHALFCCYAIKRQLSTKLIGENMFCMKAHQLSIVLPSKSRLAQLRIYTSYTKTCFFPWCYVLFFQNDLLLVICTIQMLLFYSIFILFLNYS